MDNVEQATEVARKIDEARRKGEREVRKAQVQATVEEFTKLLNALAEDPTVLTRMMEDILVNASAEVKLKSGFTLSMRWENPLPPPIKAKVIAGPFKPPISSPQAGAETVLTAMEHLKKKEEEERKLKEEGTPRKTQNFD